MTAMDKDGLENRFKREFPWGTLFAERRNFESGYLNAEGRLVEKYFKNEPNKWILVIGSGNGREARPICGYDCRIVCMDIGSIYLKAGKRLFSSERVQNVSFVQGDTKYLPFADDSFDFVFFSLYSPLGKYRFDVLHDIHRILRIGGLVLLTSLTSQYRNDKWHVISNKEQLIQEVLSCGFELIDGEIDPFRPEYRVSMLKYI
jgi:ubiquinone/menaquinone biosynthesis C-methylase UbiE